MEDNHRARERTVVHGFETNRLEDQLWTIAYEQVWPVIRRRCQRPTEPGQQCRETRTTHAIARRA